MNYKLFFTSLIISVLFSGCAMLPAWEPLVYKESTEKPQYNRSIEVKYSKDLKVYVDNRFDIDRIDRFFERSISRIYNDDYIPSIKDDIIIVDKHSNFIFPRSEPIKIESNYSYKSLMEALWGSEFSLKNIKRVPDGIVFTKLNEPIKIFYAYSMLQKHSLAYGITTPFKLDTNALEKNQAHFTDEYLKKYTLKSTLEKEFEKKGFIIVQDINKADIVVLTENLGFGNLKKLAKFLPYPKSEYMTYNQLVNNSINLNQFYYEEPKLLMFENIAPYLLEKIEYQRYKGVGHVDASGVGLALGLLKTIDPIPIGGPISSIDSITIYQNKQKIGKLINLSFAKDEWGHGERLQDPGYKYRTFTYNEILSDDTIDRVIDQAAKQVLSKIEFVEK